MFLKILSYDLFSKLSFDIKKKFPLIVLSTLLLSFLEMLSLSMIVPIITIVLKGSYEGIFSQFLIYLNLNKLLNENLLFFILIISFLIFIIKLSYSTWHAFFQSRYIYDIQKYISGKLYSLRGLPSFQKPNESSPEELSHKILNETSQLTIYFTVPLSIIFSEITTVFALIFLLFLIDPLAAFIFLGISISSSGLFYFFIRKKVSDWGKNKVYWEQKRADFVMRGINDGIQFNLIGLKEYFLNLFDKYNDNISRLLTIQRSFLLIPRSIVEFFSVVALFVCVLIYVYLEKDLNSIFITMSLITIISMRIMPSLNKIAVSIQEFRFAKPLIKSILDEFKYENENLLEFAKFRGEGSLYSAEGVIEFKGKSKKINLSMKEKDSIIITGPSGCGKSTLLRSMIGLNSNFSKVSFRKKNEKNIKIAFLNNSPNLFMITLIENILLNRKIKNEELQYIINICLLNELDLLGKGGGRVVGENGFEPSTGEKQRIVLARALVSFPEILILDESLSSLDNKSFCKIEENLLQKFSGLFIHVSHQNTNIKKYTTHIEFN
jgi:ABC-type multidrug transport system fused ATPase/permease subunit